MSASVAETVLARVETVLTGATAAGTRVDRGRAGARAPEELPALFLSRDSTAHEPVGAGGDAITLAFDIDCIVRGSDWETTADALHVEVHAALFSDAVLAGLGRGLRCAETTAQAEEGDATTGRLRCRYQIQAMSRRHDLTKPIN